MSTEETQCPACQANPNEMYQRIGELTRALHDALQQLGYDKQIEASLGSLPDARSRLDFIAKLTGNAAEKVLNTVDQAQAQQEALLAEAGRVEALVSAGAAQPEVSAFISRVKDNAQATCGQLTEIMMAQDFHDLTGQTVRKVVAIATTLEDSLVKLLVEAKLPSAPGEAEHGFLDGPVADKNRNDVVADQAQVDDLLESLGF